MTKGAVIVQTCKLLVLRLNQVNQTDGHLNDAGQVDKCFLDYEHKNLDESVDNKVHPNEDPTNFTVCVVCALCVHALNLFIESTFLHIPAAYCILHQYLVTYIHAKFSHGNILLIKFCQPWAERSCCRSEDVGEAKYDKLFGDWIGVGGACGDVSAACKQFFVEGEAILAVDTLYNMCNVSHWVRIE